MALAATSLDCFTRNKLCHCFMTMCMHCSERVIGGWFTFGNINYRIKSRSVIAANVIIIIENFDSKVWHMHIISISTHTTSTCTYKCNVWILYLCITELDVRQYYRTTTHSSHTHSLTHLCSHASFITCLDHMLITFLQGQTDTL